MKPEWGHKHECPSCSAHFYDMRKPDARCPKCHTPANDEATLLAKARHYDAPPRKKPSSEEILKDFDDIDVDLKVGSDDEDFLEDTDELGDDDTDMSEIMEHVDHDGDEIR